MFVALKIDVLLISVCFSNTVQTADERDYMVLTETLIIIYNYHFNNYHDLHIFKTISFIIRIKYKYIKPTSLYCP